MYKRQIQQQSRLLGATKEEVFEQPSSAITSLLHFVDSNFDHVDEVILRETSVARVVKWLVTHDLASIRELATRLHTAIRSRWMGQQRLKRARLD